MQTLFEIVLRPQDIFLMKQLNFNAVRASHYPNHPRWWVGTALTDAARCAMHVAGV